MNIVGFMALGRHRGSKMRSLQGQTWFSFPILPLVAGLLDKLFNWVSHM